LKLQPREKFWKKEKAGCLEEREEGEDEAGRREEEEMAHGTHGKHGKRAQTGEPRTILRSAFYLLH
jgi:hypothetical protein